MLIGISLSGVGNVSTTSSIGLLGAGVTSGVNPNGSETTSSCKGISSTLSTIFVLSSIFGGLTSSTGELENCPKKLSESTSSTCSSSNTDFASSGFEGY